MADVTTRMMHDLRFPRVRQEGKPRRGAQSSGWAWDMMLLVWLRTAILRLCIPMFTDSLSSNASIQASETPLNRSEHAWVNDQEALARKACSVEWCAPSAMISCVESQIQQLEILGGRAVGQTFMTTALVDVKTLSTRQFFVRKCKDSVVIEVKHGSKGIQ